MTKHPTMKRPLGDTTRFKVKRYVVQATAYAIAESVTGEIGVTWRPTQDRPKGFPNTRGYQQWFILPDGLASLVLTHEDVLTR